MSWPLGRNRASTASRAFRDLGGQATIPRLTGLRLPILWLRYRDLEPKVETTMARQRGCGWRSRVEAGGSCRERRQNPSSNSECMGSNDPRHSSGTRSVRFRFARTHSLQRTYGTDSRSTQNDSGQINRFTLSGDYDSRAATVQLGKIAAGGHANRQAWAFPTNDRTIVVRLQQRALEASATGAAAVTGFPKLARLACIRKSSRLLERVRVQNVRPYGEQIR